jgi:hypothetical protein
MVRRKSNYEFGRNLSSTFCKVSKLGSAHPPGAGGLQAQYRFGAQTGLAPIIFGSVLLVLSVGFADDAASLFAIIPIGAVGALLIMAGTDLAVSRLLFDARPSRWPVRSG